MLIPSIDLQGGKVVQLIQGEKLAIASDDLDGWIAKFAKASPNSAKRTPLARCQGSFAYAA